MPTFTDTAVKQLSDQNSVGTCLGASTTDKIAFYTSSTSAPVAQPSGSQQTAVPTTGATKVGGAALVQYTTAQIPAAVAANTSAEQSITVTGVLATDMAIVNSFTSQAGLGLCSGRISAANTLKFSFVNVSTASITPTSGSYLVTTLGANMQLTAALTPASVGINTCSEQSFTVTGLQTGMIVQVNKPTQQAGLAVLSSRVSANNTLAITFMNATTTAITPTAGETYEILALNGLTPVSPMVEYGVNVGTLAAVSLQSSSEQAVTVAGVAASDFVVGVSKPTAQAGIAVGNGRVSAANTIAINFINASTAAVTPTGSEVYNIGVYKPNATTPLEIFTSTTITPTSVAANTTAEQTFTVTGLTSGQACIAAPNFNLSNTPGLGLGGARISATNTLALTFVNATSTAITPPAGTWTVGMLIHTTPTVGNFTMTYVNPVVTSLVTLANGLRSALVAVNLIAGS